MSIKRIRAVDCALLVIDVLSQSGSCSLTELRQKTGLDYAGLLRILGTMIDRGWVRQLIVEKRYELSHSLGDILGAEARAPNGRNCRANFAGIAPKPLFAAL